MKVIIRNGGGGSLNAYYTVTAEPIKVEEETEQIGTEIKSCIMNVNEYNNMPRMWS